MEYFKAAEEKLGRDRAEVLCSDLEQLSSDIERLRSVALDAVETEPASYWGDRPFAIKE
jgi:hypothetical protein